ncbi:NAD(P)H-dependent oxidoreductase [Desulfosporosinus metallidurans]|uniref:NAD(P)H-dependent oxidoreductase n=1 Tax=Desulfosporosinus metallidurans TaxID=1888891 RepID=UPI00094DD234|nr:NAD(P)H-dependent oxidoreductase [Desulfosporosinus metallidurans]
MNKEPKRVVLISSSPKVSEVSASGLLTARQEKLMKTEGLDVYSLDVRQSLMKGRTESDFEAMLQADALVFNFPLYVFCLPGILMRFLQDYYAYWTQRQDGVGGSRIYAVVNCGFPEADINREAIRVIGSFSRNTNNVFRFGVMIGGGGMLLGAQGTPFVRKTMSELNKAFSLMAEDIIKSREDVVENISVALNFPRKLYFFMGNKGWVSMAKTNGLKKKDLYCKPYSNL